MPKSRYYRRADGLYEATRTDPRTGKRIHFYGHSPREVDRKIMEYTTAAEQGRLFSVVADEWWGEIYDTVAASTLKGYTAAYHRALDEFGDDPIRQVTAQQIRNYLKRLVRDGYTTKTVKTYLQVIRQICEHGVTCDSYDLDYNPCARVTVPEGKSSTRRLAADPADEKKIRDNPDVWLCPYLLMYTGLRRGEALALTWADIDLESMSIHVTKSVDYSLAKNRPQIKPPKSAAGSRSVPILEPLLRVLRKYGGSTGYLFSDDGGISPMSEGRFAERWQRYCDALNISVTPHQLRHSYATMLHEQGIDLKTAQYWLGHSTAAMTQDVYTHLRDSKLRQDAILLNERIKTAVG